MPGIFPAIKFVSCLSEWLKFCLNFIKFFAFSKKPETVTDKTKTTVKPTTAKDDSGTVFQMQRVDMLLAELLRKFPPPIPPMVNQQQLTKTENDGTESNNNASEAGGAQHISLTNSEIKTEPSDLPPPEKKIKI